MQKTFLREFAGVAMRAGVVVATIVICFWSLSALWEVESGISDGFCNVAVFPVDGVIVPFHGIGEFDLITTPDSVERFVSAAEQENNIQGILVEINSPGGTPVASERIAERFRTSSLPVVGLAGDMAASGAYMVAAATDHLIASPMSDIGSIGVNMSYLEESEKNEEEGLTYVQLTTGKFKDAGSPNRPITDEERELFLADLDIVHQHFIDVVARYRDLPRDDVVAVADGASMPGARAIGLGLVDQLGGRAEAAQSFANILGLTATDIVFCEYQSPLLPF